MVYGGDGTVMETMTGLINNERKIPLAQLPGGTANLLARALGIPVDMEQALEVALNGVAVPLDVGYLPEKDLYFSLVAGAGWDASLIEDASREIKNRLGFFAYVLTGVKNLYNLRRSRITLEIDGERHQFRAHTVMLVNVGEILGTGFALGKDMSPHDGKLNLAVASPNSLGGILKLVFRLVTKRFENYRDLQYFSGCEVRVEANPPLKLELDGEAVGETPFSARIVPGGATFGGAARLRRGSKFERGSAGRERNAELKRSRACSRRPQKDTKKPTKKLTPPGKGVSFGCDPL